MTDADRSMQAYYAQRAPAYDRVYARPERQADLRAIEGWIAGPFAGRRVLEVAAGTGWWTVHAARDAADWLATDTSAETLAIARARPAMPKPVRFALADAYALDALGELGFDAAFAGFWWSHVPVERLRAWIDHLCGRLAPGARVVFVDNRFVPGSSTPVARTDLAGNTWQRRSLDDGSVHEVLKNFPSRDEVRSILVPHAASFDWIEHGFYWVADWTLA